jgi:hypothetical protein
MPTGCDHAYVEVWGGGGGGASSVGGTGGGGGGYSAKIIALAVGTVVPVTVAAAVAAATNGQSSSFGSFCSASGGLAAGTGGTGTGGDVNLSGYSGNPGIAGTTIGAGGAAPFMGAGAGQVGTDTHPAGGFGQGGGSGTVGGTGGLGLVRVWSYAAASQIGPPGPAGPVSTTIPKVQIFTTSGTYAPSANLAGVIIECIGGGGGGGGTSTAGGTWWASGGGGGSGAYARRVLTPAQIGTSQAITIGQAGAGGGPGVGGGTGASTSLGSLVIATGGGGGALGSTAAIPFGGIGGAVTGCVGDVVFAGSPGIAGNYNTTAIAGNMGANGGSSAFGGGAVNTTAGAGTGVSASNYGSGGSGASTADGTGRNGGNGSNGIVIVTEFIASVTPTAPSATVFPGMLSGLGMQSDTPGTPTTVLDVSPGTACSDDNTTMMVLSSIMQKRTSNPFAAGSGATVGSLDTGAITANTWYHVFLIARADTGVVDILTSLSATAPLMPSPYTKKRRIGSFKTSGTSVFVGWLQRGRTFYWQIPVQDIAGTAVSSTPANLTFPSIPPGVQVRPILSVEQQGASATTSLRFYSPDLADNNVQTYMSMLGGSISGATGFYSYAEGIFNYSNTSQQLRVFANYGGTCLVVVLGWVDDVT